MFSKDLEYSIGQCYKQAREARHEFMTVEHLLLALLENPAAVAVLKACGVNQAKLACGKICSEEQIAVTERALGYDKPFYEQWGTFVKGIAVGREFDLGADNIHILLHEMGHTYGLDDFYDWDPLPGQGFIMKAGSATQITEFDKWMFRDWWRHLKSRYGF